MTWFYQHDDYLRHATGQHPERAERVRRVISHLQQEPLWDRLHQREPPVADEATIAAVHDRAYVRHMRDVAASGGGRVEADTVVSEHSFQAASRAVGAVCDAVTHVVSGATTNAFCLVRPPGHHALQAAPMGFCLFNSIAVAAQLAVTQLGLKRVLIVDWDVHHGNGTQDCFWESEQVAFFSVHRSPFYPGTGAASETGARAGLGTIRNLPVTFGTARADYLAGVAAELGEFADRMRPELILVSAGFDAHRLDPVGSLGLETEDFVPLTQLVCQLAATHCRDRLVSVLEGGYNVDVLPSCVATHLTHLLHATRLTTGDS